jgi:hypothetical protein
LLPDIFGSCQIRVLRVVNDAPAIPTLETPGTGLRLLARAHRNLTPECVTSLLNVRYAVIGWNLVSLGTPTDSLIHPPRRGGAVWVLVSRRDNAEPPRIPSWSSTQSGTSAHQRRFVLRTRKHNGFSPGRSIAERWD